MVEEVMDVFIDGGGFNLMENENMCCTLQQRASEPSCYVHSWLACYRELDFWDLGNQLSQHKEDGRFRVTIFALVEGIDHNNGQNISKMEQINKKLLHLILKQLVYDIRIGLEEGGE